MSHRAEIRARYALQRGDFELDVDVSMPMRGITGVFGESGAGKTSLLRCIAGLEQPDFGELVVAGEPWQGEKTSLAVHERNVGYVFQEPRLFPHLRVRGNLEYGLRRSKAADKGIDEIVELLGLESMLERDVGTLSGGEAQRVAIARALLRNPDFVLMDEPLASLDRGRRHEILPFLDRLHLQRKIPVIYVSHSIDEIARLCDYLVVMDAGRVVASGVQHRVLLRTDIPVLGGEEAGAVIDARVVAYDEGFDLTRVRFSGGDFWVPGRHGAGDALRLRIRAGDVSLCREAPGRTTILNVLPAVVESIVAESKTTDWIGLKLGSDRAIARITRRSTEELGLQPGDEVFAQVKSVAVRNAPVDPAPLRGVSG